MSYQRVIPRDLFNESSLLKCYGRLYILTEGNPNAHFADDFVDSFDIVQRADDGFLFIENLPFVIGSESYRLVRPLNSRASWPLYAERLTGDDGEAITVFTDAGDLTLEMNYLINGVSACPISK